MRFYEVLTQIIGLLALERRVSYQALKRRFDLDDAYLTDVKAEIVDVHRLAVDQDGTMLVWTGGLAFAATPAQPAALDVAPAAADRQGPALASTAVPPAAPPVAPAAERRQVTVLFCDLVDSTKVSRQLDPEDYRTVIHAYQEAAVTAIQPFDGYVAQYLGDGLLLYFGWPQAHEDAASRAVHASLAMLDALGPLNTRLEPRHGVRVAIRIGLHTGLAVIGTMGSGTHQEALAMGDTPNIAARIQGLAESNTVALSATTARLVQGVFALEALGAHHLKGVTEPMPVCRVLGLLEASSDEVAAVPGPVRFLVGRNEEVGLLRRRWEQSKEGLGQVVLISGEAGIGKSTLVQALRAYVGREDATWITCHCSPYHTNSVLYPVIEHLQRALGWQMGDPAAAKLDKLEQGLRTSRLPLQEAVPLLAALLSVPCAERYALPVLTPQQQKQQTLDTLVAWMAEEAERQPVLAVWDDLHWADPTTLELLGLFVDQAPMVPMLHVLTFRPVFVPSWPTRSHMTPLTLSRLERLQSEALITHLGGGKSLPVEVVQHIVAKTDGVPLFVEELTKMLLESELLREEAEHYALTGSLSTAAIPATLQDSLMARLDRLPAARDVAQLGAVLGREFSYDLLRAVSPLDEATLQARLAQLVATELLYQRGRPPRATYIFKHALIQDAAYASLLRSTRQQYHQRVAHVLAARFPETVEAQPELLAHHYTEAALTEDAVHFWHKAGQQASTRSAYVEAMAHLRQGLEVLQALPETTVRAQHELMLQLTLGESLEASQGYTAPEVAQAYTRVHELCQHVDASPQLFPVLVALRRFYTFRGEMQTAQELAEQLLRLAQRQPDDARLQEAHWALGQTLYFRGEFVPARAHLEQSITGYAPRPLSAQADRDAAGTQIACLLVAAYNLWTLGYADQALESAHEGLRLAHELAHPFTLVMGLSATAVLHWFRREVQAAHELTETLLARVKDQEFPDLLAAGTALRGWTLAMQGQAEAGITQGRQVLASQHNTSAHRWHIPLVLAEVYRVGGHAGEGLRLLAEALAVMDDTGVRHLEAESYRLQGELLLVQSADNHAAAETCLSQALALARRQQARAWELRAAMSLSRLWQQQGKPEDARQLLAGVYGWFTEGLETPDLQEARALLAALAS